MRFYPSSFWANLYSVLILSFHCENYILAGWWELCDAEGDFDSGTWCWLFGLLNFKLFWSLLLLSSDMWSLFLVSRQAYNDFLCWNCQQQFYLEDRSCEVVWEMPPSELVRGKSHSYTPLSFLLIFFIEKTREAVLALSTQSVRKLTNQMNVWFQGLLFSTQWNYPGSSE